MSPAYAKGRADWAAGVCRFANPYPMGSADFSIWRRAWDQGVNEERLDRARLADSFNRLASRETRQVGNNNMNLEGR